MSTKRACDSCHRRKIKCVGLPPCDNCRHLDLECTFNAVPKKKGPSGRRANIIYAIRASQLQAKSFSTLLPPPQAPPNASRDLNLEDHTGLTPSPALKSCVDVFFWRMYPIMPVLQRDTVYNSLSTTHLSPEAYCLITALCGIVIIQPRMDSVSYPASHGNFELPPVEYLIQETIRGRNRWDYIGNPTLWTVITSFFLFGCFFGLDKHNAAWFYLRESITFAELIGLPYEESYEMLEEGEAALRRRMFWLLFVTEREYALQRHRPLSLRKFIGLPEVPEGEESLVLQGFLDLVNLFQHFDASFVSLWNQSATMLSDISWIPRLQENLALSILDVGHRTEIQQADLLIARDMAIIGRQLPTCAMESHGVGIIEKIFDIGSSLADVMKVLPSRQSRIEIGPRDYLMEMLRMLSTIRGGQSRYLPLLTAQADEVLGIGSGNPSAESFFIPMSDSGVILGEADGGESGYDSQSDSTSSIATMYNASLTTDIHSITYSPSIWAVHSQQKLNTGSTLYSRILGMGG